METDDRYEIIGNKCIYFSKEEAQFNEAKSICNAKSGILYEPKSLSHLQLVRNSNKKRDTKNCFWLGIDDRTTEGTYLYNSDNSPLDPSIESTIVYTNGCFGPDRPDGKNCDHLYTCHQITHIYTHHKNGKSVAAVCEI